MESAIGREKKCWEAADAPPVDEAAWFDYQMLRESAFNLQHALMTVAEQVAPRLCQTLRQTGKPLLSAALAAGISQEVRDDLRAAWRDGYTQAWQETIENEQLASPPAAPVAESQTTVPEKLGRQSRSRAKTAAPPQLPFAPATSGAARPIWFHNWWQTPAALNGRLWVEILGQTGEPLYAHVSAAFAQQRGITQYASSETHAVQDLVRRQLLRRDKVRLGNRAYYLVALTERGQEAYRLLFDREPETQHYLQLLKFHTTPERVLLAVLTQEVLEKTGYQVERYPLPISAEELGMLRPDLVAQRDEQTCFIYIVDTTEENAEQLAFDWQWLVAATPGPTYLAVPTLKVLQQVRPQLERAICDWPDAQVNYLVVGQVLGQLEHYNATTTIWQA